MIRLAALLVTLAAIAVPTAAPQTGPPQPSAMERLFRQEDARRNDPRLGLVESPVPQPSAIERLVRQEDARSSDPRLGLTSAPPAVVPAIEVVGDGAFDWLSAVAGAFVGASLLLVVSGAIVLARALRPAHPRP